jgi:hypothetical protein
VADVWLLWWLGPVLLEHVALSGSVSLNGRVYWRQCSTTASKVACFAHRCYVLPLCCRPKGSFLRGCCESFSLSSAAGDIGRIEAVRVWHEPGGGSIGGGWCLQRVDVEAVLRGGCCAMQKVLCNTAASKTLKNPATIPFSDH